MIITSLSRWMIHVLLWSVEVLMQVSRVSIHRLLPIVNLKKNRNILYNLYFYYFCQKCPRIRGSVELLSKIFKKDLNFLLAPRLRASGHGGRYWRIVGL